jgi:ABC-type bacteriocin/lantibiotic exporter with double-glycine peptidase domain
MFSWQERTWTCGPAALKIALNILGINKTEKYLASILKTTKLNGTKNSRFIKVAKKYNLEYIMKNNSSFKEIKRLKLLGYTVILNYFSKINHAGHFAVVKHINTRRINLLDPSLGPRTSYSLKYFHKVWHSHTNKNKRWFFAMKKRKKANNLKEI